MNWIYEQFSLNSLSAGALPCSLRPRSCQHSCQSFWPFLHSPHTVGWPRTCWSYFQCLPEKVAIAHWNDFLDSPSVYWIQERCWKAMTNDQPGGPYKQSLAYLRGTHHPPKLFKWHLLLCRLTRVGGGERSLPQIYWQLPPLCQRKTLKGIQRINQISSLWGTMAEKPGEPDCRVLLGALSQSGLNKRNYYY